MSQKINKSNTALKLWLPIGVSILIPLLLINIATGYLLKIIKNEDYVTNLEKMEQASTALERILYESNTTIQLVSSDKKIISLGLSVGPQTQSSYVNIAKADTVCKQLSFYDTGGYLTSFYFGGTDTFLSSAGTCDDAAKYYHTLYEYGDLELSDIQTFAASKHSPSVVLPMSNVIIDGSEQSGIIILRRLPKIKNALVATVIKKGTLDDILALTTHGDGMSYITDVNGTLLYSYGGTPTQVIDSIDNNKAAYVKHHPYQKTSLVTSAGTNAGYRLFAVNSRNTIYTNTLRLNWLVWILNIICIFIALLISFIIIQRRIGKLKNVLYLIAPKQKSRKKEASPSLYDQIDEVVSTLVDHNKQLTDQIESQSQILSATFWDSAFMGTFNDDASLLDAAKKCGIKTDSPFYCLLVISFKSSDFSNLADIERLHKNTDGLFERLSQTVHQNVYVHKIGIAQITVLLSMTDAEKATYRQVVCDFLAEYHAYCEIKDISIVVSEMFNNFSSIYYYYSLCKTLTNNYSISQTTNGILWSDDTNNKLANEFYFPSELENRITSGIIVGNFQIVKEGFRLVILNNFENKNISPTMVSIVRSKLRIVIATAYHNDMNFELKDVFEQIVHIASDALLIAYVLAVCEKMCEFYQEYNQNKSVDMKQKIIQYINEEFSNPAMCLSMIAAHFSFSESHFSRMAKELLGESFSSYLERTRMEYADKLIVETDMKVDKIALQSSYDNVDSFRRAYKRYIGITPSERRQKEKS